MNRTNAVILCTLLLLAGLAALARTVREDPVTETVRIERGDATHATIDLSADAGRIRLGVLPAGSSDALAGTIDVAPRERLVGDAERASARDLAVRYHAQQRPGPHLSFTGPLWDLALAPEVATDLRVRTTVGAADLDLRGAAVRTLASRSEVGRQVIHLPEGVAEADIRTDVGSIELYLPAGANAEIALQKGMATVNAAPGLAPTPQGYRLEGEGALIAVDIRTSLGSVTLGTY